MAEGDARVPDFATAGVAQLAEQRICNPQVKGSSPLASSSQEAGSASEAFGTDVKPKGAGVAERSMAADCKSAGQCPTVVQIHPPAPVLSSCGSNSGVESQPSKLLVAGSNPVSRSTGYGWLGRAHVAQSVEHVLGKDGVTSSNLVVGSMSTSRQGVRWSVTSRTGAEATARERRGKREAKRYGQAEV